MELEALEEQGFFSTLLAAHDLSPLSKEGRLDIHVFVFVKDIEDCPDKSVTI